MRGIGADTRGMRRLGPVVAVVVALLAAVVQPAGAYPGAPWFEPGKTYDQNFPDPGVLFDPGSGRYYAYATTTGGAYLPAMSSTDAAAWVARAAYPQPDCVPHPDDPFFNDALPCPAGWSPDVHGGRLTKQVWAPGVARIGGHWVLFYAARVSTTGERFCLSVATADDPLGPFVDATAAPFHCDSDPNGSIDPQPFVDPTNGRPYLIWKSEGVPGSLPTRFWVRELTADGLAFAPGSSARVVLATSQPWEGNVVESPSMVRFGGRWLLFYSANEWDSTAYATGVAFCDTPTGPCFKSPHNPVLRSEGSILGPGGPSAFVDASGSLRLAHHYWLAPHVGYPSDPGCDGIDPRTQQPSCASQGQRRMRITWVTVQSDRVTITTTPPPVITARDIDSACPRTLAPAIYTDVGSSSPHARAISCMTSWQVTNGTGPGTYSPSAPVTREQMASFVARLIDATDAQLPSGAPDAFGDDEASGHEDNINRLAAVGIVTGTGPGQYSPSGSVPRGQMATFLARAGAFVLGHPLAPGADAFGDDSGSVHEANVNATAAAGIATGTGPGSFSPDQPVSRAQMAGFLARLADLLVDEGRASPPLV
jgi:hypothetical protein